MIFLCTTSTYFKCAKHMSSLKAFSNCHIFSITYFHIIVCHDFLTQNAASLPHCYFSHIIVPFTMFGVRSIQYFYHSIATGLCAQNLIVWKACHGNAIFMCWDDGMIINKMHQLSATLCCTGKCLCIPNSVASNLARARWVRHLLNSANDVITMIITDCWLSILLMLVYE